MHICQALVLSASDFFRAAEVRGEFPVCVVLATGHGHRADKRGQLQDRARCSELGC
jgi:hypothetical protein